MAKRRFLPVTFIAAAGLLALTLMAGSAAAQESPASPAAGAETPHPAHIHSGSCAALGDVVYPLTDVAAPGAMSTPMAGVASPVPTRASGAGISATPSAGDEEVVAESTTTVQVALADISAGGFAINLSGDAGTLEIDGAEHIRTYRARMHDAESGEETRSSAERKFCGECGSALWLWDPTWPELLHPHASAIDTPLPVPPEHTHLMLGSKASWVEPCFRSDDKTFDGYPDESIAAWHQRLGLER